MGQSERLWCVCFMCEFFTFPGRRRPPSKTGFDTHFSLIPNALPVSDIV
jgi:hypothetical protein